MKKELSTMKNECVLTIEDLSEELLSLKWQEGIELFKVVQEAPKYGRISYLLRGLECKTECNVILFSDNDEIILQNSTYSLSGLLIDRIEKITKYDTEDDNKCYRIELKSEYNGYFEIHPVQ
jgi:hypothetical protein